jgi:proteasome component ECM29
VNVLYELYLGTCDLPGKPKTAPDDRKSIAGVRLRPLLLTQLNRSLLAASTMPAALLTVIDAVFGKETTAKIRVLGLRLTNSIFEKATDAAIKSTGAVLLNKLLSLLNDPSLPNDVQGLAYAAVGRLAKRLPQLFHDNVQLLERFFAASCGCSPEIRAHILEALSMMYENRLLSVSVFCLLLSASVGRPVWCVFVLVGGRCLFAVAFRLLRSDCTSGGVQNSMVCTTSQCLTNIRRSLTDPPLSYTKPVACRYQHYAQPGPGAALRLIALLNKFVSREEQHARLLAVQFANVVFSKSDMPSRFVCLLAAGDNGLDIKEEVRRGLVRVTNELERDPRASKKTEATLPPFATAVRFVHGKMQHGLAVSETAAAVSAAAATGGGAPASAALLPFHDPIFARLLLFLRSCLGLSGGVFEDEETNVLESGVVGGRLTAIANHLDELEMEATMQDTESVVEQYLQIIERGVRPAASPELQEEALASLVELVAALPTALAPKFKNRLAWLKPFMFSPREAVRDPACRLVGLIAAELTADDFRALVKELLATAVDGKGTLLEKRHGALTTLGFVLSTLSLQPPDWRPLAPEVIQEALELIIKSVDETESMLICAALRALGEVGRHAALPLPLGKKPEDKSSVVDAATSDDQEPQAKRAKDDTDGASGGGGVNATSSGGAATAAGVAATMDAAESPMDAADSSPNTAVAAANTHTKRSVMEKLLKLAAKESSAGNIREAAVTSIGTLCIGDWPHPHFNLVLEGLGNLAKVKTVDVHFSVGITLCCLGAGKDTTAAVDPWHLSDPAADKAAVAVAAPTAMAVDDANEPGSDADVCPAPGDALATVLSNILDVWVPHPRAGSRQAAGIWLMTLLKNCGEHVAVLSKLQQIQQAFTGLLSEGDEFTQDIASKGVGLLYELGDEETKAALVATLVGTLSDGMKSKTQKFSRDDESQVFAAGELGSTPGKDGRALTTYKELCGLASDMNKPDMIYQFMQLANHNTMWNSRKGAAFGFATIANKAQEALQKHLPDLVPKLYRYLFDPNTGIRESMQNIWKTVAPEPAKAVDTHFKAIIDDLLANITGKQWRTREACCGAIADVLRGRRWDEVGEYMVKLWQVGFRAIDDIKESVRLAAQATVRRLAKCTVLLCNRDRGTSGREAVAVLLPCLINDGLLSGVDDIRMQSIHVLMDLAKEAGPALKPHLTEFICVLLDALSGLEAPMLNYLATRMSKESGNQDKLDDIRLHMAKTSPITDTLDSLIKYIDAEVLTTLVPRLEHIIKKGIGQSTKAGCARIIEQLARQCGSDLHPHASVLLKAMLSAARGKSAPVRRDFSSAIGHFVRAAPAASVDMIVSRCKKMYVAKESDDYVEASATICQAIARHAPDILKAVSTQVLPMAFTGMYDPSAVVAKVWTEVWTNNVGGNEGGIRLYLTELIALIVPTFDHRSWDIKRQGARALALVADNAYKGSMDVHADRLLDVVIEVLKGRTFDGKDALVQCLVAVAGASREFIAATPEKMKRVVEALMREAGKDTNKEYKLAVLAHVSTFLKGCKEDCDELAAVVKIVTPAVTPTKADDEDDADSDEEERRKLSARGELLIIAGYDTLGKAVAASPTSGVVECSAAVWALVVSTAAACTWKVAVPVFVTAQAMLKRDMALLADPDRLAAHLKVLLPAALLHVASKHAAPRKTSVALLLAVFTVVGANPTLATSFAAGTLCGPPTEAATTVAVLAEDSDPEVRKLVSEVVAVLEEKLGVVAGAVAGGGGGAGAGLMDSAAD